LQTHFVKVAEIAFTCRRRVL